MKRFIISDTHFGHENIIRYENRPFRNSNEMNRYIINKWNNVVSKNDLVYHLGDVSFMSRESTKNILNKLNGRIVLVAGNHDLKLLNWYRNLGRFEMVSPYPIIVDKFAILSHEPLYLQKDSVYANIYGHVHGDDKYKTITRDSACVCLERWNYQPISLDFILNKIRSILS